MLCCDVITIAAEVPEVGVIARIMGGGQFKLADSHFTELNRLDDELVEASGIPLFAT